MSGAAMPCHVGSVVRASDERHDKRRDTEDHESEDEGRDREAHDLPNIELGDRKDREQPEGLDHVGHGLTRGNGHRDLAQIGR